tara:strand:+ start:1605 stop:2060 length:456 start_codon:yes stop_codon:yes gene_type:complete
METSLKYSTERIRITMKNVYYFAYGVNLEEHSMKKRYPSAEIFKFGVLRGFKLKFKDGISSVEEREQSDYVEGLIYTVNEKDIEPPSKESIRCEVDVITDCGNVVRAVLFFVKKKEESQPSEEYLSRMLKKYGDYGFNKNHLESAFLSSTS